MYERKNRILMTNGMSLVEVLLTAGIMGFIALAMASVMVSQRKESRMLASKLATLDLQQLLISVLADGSVCSFILTDPSQASHRSAAIINTNHLDSEKIKLNRILARPQSDAPVIVQTNEEASPLAPELKVQEIVLGNFAGSGDFYTAELKISFAFPDLSNLRVPRDITVKTTLQTDSVSPATAKRITGCQSASSSRTWRNLSGQRSLNVNYVNDTSGDIDVNVQVYSGASGNRCSVSIAVDGVGAGYNFINDSNGACMCNATVRVPSGGTYRAESSGAGYLFHWAELR